MRGTGAQTAAPFETCGRKIVNPQCAAAKGFGMPMSLAGNGLVPGAGNWRSPDFCKRCKGLPGDWAAVCSGSVLTIPDKT